MNNKNRVIGLALQATLLMQVLAPIAAHSLDLADVPMAVQNRASPNIMFTLDNSGSMAWSFMPDSMMATYINQTYTYYGRNNCYKNGIANGVYYNPAVTYKPGKRADGSSYPDASFTAAFADGYKSDYAYATTGAGTYYGAPYYGFTQLGPKTSGAINLATSFQAYFDHAGVDPVYGIYHFDTPAAAYYYRYTGTNPAEPSPATCYADSSYTKVIVSATSGPNGTDERVNFANWFTYHRTRMLTMKTGLSAAFATIGKNYRVGLSTINKDDGGVNNNGDNFVPLKEFTSCAANESCQKSTWYAALFAVRPLGGTPLVEATRKVGEYFRTGSMPGVSPATADPIIYSCQQNFQIVSTDGYWNGSVPTVGNRDRTVPNLPEPVENDPIAGGKALTPGNVFPAPFYEGSTETSNTLADVAMEYWVTDLRTSLDNNVVANDLDPATWQHLVTSSIGLGANGSLVKDKATYEKLVSGEISWPAPVANTNTAIDDLWHAAVNGHGEYFSAKNPGELQAGLSDALSNIVARGGAAAAVAVNNPNLSTSDNVSFASSYNAGEWSGDLNAYPIDQASGAVDIKAPIWPGSAQAQLDGKDWTTRFIGSYSGTAGVAFGKGEATKTKIIKSGLTEAQLSRLNSPVTPPGPGDNIAVIDFLRGSRIGEPSVDKADAPYRKRQHVLGDIVNSRSVYVAAPPANYGDTGFASFKSEQAKRTKVVYQGANDGMLHAFDAATGAELWAYVPGLLISEPYTTPIATYSSTSSLVNLSMKSSFSHRYYVDGTPVQGDIDFGNTENATGGTKWGTLLVGGLNKGGRGYYALDVTNPAASSDEDVAEKVKWEFPNDATTAEIRKNIGYSYGKPLIVKTPAAGWVVLVTSGYDNGSHTGGDGQGRLHVLNPRTGAIIKTINTGAGSAAAPSGLGQISAYVENGDLDLTIDYVYGGDLLGNLWRFDLSGATKDTWNVVKLAALVDKSGKPQPITTAPELGKSGATRLVLVGTGQYLGNSDVPGTNDSSVNATQTQTFYALVDDKSSAPLISPLRSQLQEQVLTVNGATAAVTSNLVDLTTEEGWYVDLPNSGERSVTNPALLLGVVAFTTIIPSTDPCAPGGSSWLYVLNYKNGQQTDKVGKNDALPAGQYLGKALSSEVVAVKTTTGSVNGIIVNSDGSIIAPPIVPSSIGGSGVRKMWREVISR